MFFLRMGLCSRALLAALLGSVLLVVPDLLPAQDRAGEERPRIERLVFEGVDEVDERLLRRSILTQETRCRSFILRPVCWVVDHGIFVEEHHLDRQELERDELRLEVLYFRRGYREAEVASEVRPRGGGVEVVFRVAEGPPTVIEALEVEQVRDVLAERHFRRARVPQEGQPLDLYRLDTARVRLTEMLGSRGYLDASVRDTVDVFAELQARVGLTVDPRQRATLEEIDIRGNEDVEDRTIRDATVLRPGRVITSRDIAAARRSLYESNLFHEAQVGVPEQPDSAKRLEIRVREAPPRLARVGGGFNTTEFFQTEARFVHYNWLGRGRRLDLRATAGNLLAPQLNDRAIFRDVLPGDFPSADESAFLRPTWRVSADLMQPAFRAAENTLGFSLYANRRSVPGVAIDRGYGAELSVTRRLRDRSPLTAAYDFEITTVEAGDLYFCVNYGICDLPTIGALREDQRLAPLSLSFISNHTDDPLAPTTGWRTRLDLEHASRYTLSDFGYHRISGTVAGYLPFGDMRRRVLSGRLRGGWIRPIETAGPDMEEGEQALLHPRKRFYAGGSQSVRGYGENQLGPRILTVDPDTLVAYDPACSVETIVQCDPAHVPVAEFLPRPVGGTAVLQANLEYRFPVWRELSMAVFTDGAVVRGRGEGLLGEGAAAITPGFGIRYETPVGPLRVDLGIRPTIVERLPVVTEVMEEENERRIVRLETPRDFDPLEDTGGFLRQVLSRLTLHLSIGPAF